MSNPFTQVGNVQSPEKGWHQHKGNIHLPDSSQEAQVRQHTHAGKVGLPNLQQRRDPRNGLLSSGQWAPRRQEVRRFHLGFLIPSLVHGPHAPGVCLYKRAGQIGGWTEPQERRMKTISRPCVLKQDQMLQSYTDLHSQKPERSSDSCFPAHRPRRMSISSLTAELWALQSICLVSRPTWSPQLLRPGHPATHSASQLQTRRARHPSPPSASASHGFFFFFFWTNLTSASLNSLFPLNVQMVIWHSDVVSVTLRVSLIHNNFVYICICKLCCTGWTISPQIHIYPVVVNVNLLGGRVFADVIKLKWDHWVSVGCNSNVCGS